MGAYRTRRPFIWQDEMAEVKNLFRRVAKVRHSAFTGFSLWKDEPTAETLSRNRLWRRRSQFALDLTHLNYGESPYEALNHINNIRGMCARIQRQSHSVERRKKDHDLDLQPALLRRPVTAYSWSSKEGSEKSGYRPSRPGSAPVSIGTPLHYTPSRPTMLYDATHRCPRSRDSYKRPSLLGKSGRSTALNAMTNNWDSRHSHVASGPHSTASSTRTVNVAPTHSPSFRLRTDSSPEMDRRSRSNLEPVYSEVGNTSDAETTSVLYSEVETEPSILSSSGPSSVGQVERPPSRMMSKRPTADINHSDSAVAADKHRDNSEITLVDVSFKDLFNPGNTSIGREIVTQTTRSVDMLPHSRSPSRKGRQEDPIKKNLSKSKPPLTPADGSGGLWALRQQQRPMSAGSMMPESGFVAAMEPPYVRPATSPTRPRTVVADHFPLQERASRFGSSPSTNKIARKKEQLQFDAVQRACDQELQQVALSDYVDEKEKNHPRFTPDEERRSSFTAAAAAPSAREADGFSSSNDSFGQSSVTSPSVSRPLTEGAVSDGEESHVMIKHSTDPFTDFKTSMLRMIQEENLYDKEWELEELFQYYMSLNPAVHHQVLKLVIVDIRKDIASGKIRP